jgi:CBS domain-containing protein
MTRDVVTVGPETLVKRAAEVMAERGFAALPVVDENNELVGMVAEADVLRDRVPPDPRLHLRRDEAPTRAVPPRLVLGVMTADVRSVEACADVADVARIFVHEHVRSVPVLEHGRTVGILSRRDLLRGLVRPDAGIQADLRRLVEDYTGETGCWDIAVTDGVATIMRADGASGSSADVEERALLELAATVGGVVSIHVLPQPAPSRQRSTHPHDASARPVPGTERDTMKATSQPRPIAVHADGSPTPRSAVDEPVGSRVPS